MPISDLDERGKVDHTTNTKTNQRSTSNVDNEKRDSLLQSGLLFSFAVFGRGIIGNVALA